MKKVNSWASLALATALLIYAVPRLPLGGGFNGPTVFGVLWIGLILLIMAAHLHRLFGVDEQTRHELDKVRQYRRRMTARTIERAVSQVRNPQPSAQASAAASKPSTLAPTANLQPTSQPSTAPARLTRMPRATRQWRGALSLRKNTRTKPKSSPRTDMRSRQH